MCAAGAWDGGEARSAACLLPAILALGLLACGSSPKRPIRPETDLVHPYGGVRTRAVLEVARQGDLARVPDLIELLDDEDPGVRAAAGTALEELTGHDTGYRAWAPPETLRAQVLTWRAWWAAREGGTEPPP